MNYNILYFDIVLTVPLPEDIMFIGREQELKKLSRMYISEKLEVAVIYGRRRVGKTTLINEFCKGKKTVFLPRRRTAQNRIWRLCPMR